MGDYTDPFGVATIAQGSGGKRKRVHVDDEDNAYVNNMYYHDINGVRKNVRHDLDSDRITTRELVGGDHVVDNLIVVNDATVGGDLTVTGDGTFLNVTATNDLSVGNNAIITNDLTVGGGVVAPTITDRNNVKYYGAVGDGTDDTSAIQLAIDTLQNNGTVDSPGDVLFFPAGVYCVTGIILKDRVSLQGSGRGSTRIKLCDNTNANANVITVPDSYNAGFIRSLTVDGNRANNASAGHGIYFATTPSGGQSFSFYQHTVGAFGYKHINIHDITSGNCNLSGVYIEPSNYSTFIEMSTFSHNGQDGLTTFCSDSHFSNLYCEKNGRANMYISGSNNKIINSKSLWGGRIDNTLGGIYCTGSVNTFVNCESQDCYTHGFHIRSANNKFVCCDSNTNGYSALGAEGVSSRTHANWYFANTHTLTWLMGCTSRNYKSTVGTDGFWTTEWPYYFETLGDTQDFRVFDIDYDPAKFNQAPNTVVNVLMQNSHLGSLTSTTNNNSDMFVSFDPKSPDDLGDCVIRCFRNSDSAGAHSFAVHVPNTSTQQHIIRGVGDTQLNTTSGDCVIGNGVWNERRLRLGSIYIWYDSGTGVMRWKNGAPASEIDGTAF